MDNTALEWFLLLCLLVAVGYIMYLEQQPKTDADRARRDAMEERMRETRRRHAEKMDRVQREKADQ